jgi:hypothetical protein
MNRYIFSFLPFLICLLPLAIGLIVVLTLRGKPLSMRGLQSAIQMDGATFLKTNEGNITIKRRTVYTWLLIVFFGPIELGILALAVSLVTDIIRGKGLPENSIGVIVGGFLIGAVLLQNIRTLRQPSIINFSANSRILVIGRGSTEQQILFSQISQISGVTHQTQLHKVERIDIKLMLDSAKVIELGSVTGYDALSRASAIAQQIAGLTGASISGGAQVPQIHLDPQTPVIESKQKEKPMNFFQKLFSKSEAFVPTPTQTIPGLEPIVVQAVENLSSNIEDQKRVFTYLLEQKKDHNSTYLLGLLYFSEYSSNGKIEDLIEKSHTNLDLEMMHEQFGMKSAEKWVKSITKPQV